MNFPMQGSLPSAQIEITIPFHDLDPMDIVWHGHYVRYFELARCELLESVAYNYDAMKASGYAWPVINLKVKYIKPLVFKQNVVVTAFLKEWEHRLRIGYQIIDKRTGIKLTEAFTDQVAIDMATGEMQLASPMVLLQKFGLEP